MVETRRNPINRGKQPVATMPDNEDTLEYIADAPEPKTPITEPMRSVDTDNKDKDNASEGSSSLYKRLIKTPSKERF